MATHTKKLTIEELEKELQARKEQQQQEREKEKKQYETTRNKKVNRIAAQADRLSGILKTFKIDVDTTFNEMKDLCDTYGDIRRNSQGGFTLTNTDNTFRISRKLDSNPIWNELCDKGVSLIKEFLVSNLKTRDKNLFEILMTFLEKNKKGDMNYPSIMKLLKHEDKFEDARWKEGCRLLRENFTTDFKKFYFVFSKKNEDGEWENINLNIASI
jgi:hypothetical protein